MRHRQLQLSVIERLHILYRTLRRYINAVLFMAALCNRAGHIYLLGEEASVKKLRRVLEILCGAFERCSRVRL